MNATGKSSATALRVPKKQLGYRGEDKGSRALSPLAFYSFMRENVAPRIDELVTNREYVYFGSDNLFLERMRELADNCPPLDQCIRRNALFIGGKGVEFFTKDGKEDDRAAELYKEWMSDGSEADFRASTSLDIAFGDSLTWDVRGNRGQSGTARLDHRDASQVRAAKKELINDKLIVPAYFNSSNWQIATKYATRSLPQKYLHHKPKEIPAWMPGSTESIQTLYHKTYKQGKHYYSEPVYLSAVADAFVISKVGPFNKAQIDTGFAPMIHVHFPFDSDEANLEQYMKDFQYNFIGAQGNGFISTNGEGDAPTFTVLDAKFRSGELDEVRDNASLQVIQACMIPPILAGVPTATGLGGQAQAIEQQVEYYQRSYVEPKQRIITSSLEKIMKDNGVDTIAKISPLDPFEMFGSDQVRLSTETRNEIREADGLGPLMIKENGQDTEEFDPRGYEIPGRRQLSKQVEDGE